MPVDLAKKALLAKKESKYIDFKTSFDGSNRAWLKMVKSIVAMANTSGGVLVFGVNDNGTLSGWDVEPVLQIDPAIIADKIFSYTNCQFDDFEILAGIREGSKVALLIIGVVVTPMVFKNPGTYKDDNGKHITVFQAGTLFFRHSAKSEPANTDDVRWAIEQRVAKIRQDWLKEVRKVVAAPPGSHFVIDSNDSRRSASVSYRPSKDPTVPATRFVRSNDKNVGTLLHEELSKDLFQEVNMVLEANDLLGRSDKRFTYDPTIYYWIYAQRDGISDSKKIEMLARYSLTQIYGPCIYLLLRLSTEKLVGLIKEFAENPKAPHINTLIRIMVLLGPESIKWLFAVWKKKWPGKGQHAEFYWKAHKAVEKGEYVDGKLMALKDISKWSQDIVDGPHSYQPKDLLSSPELAQSLLTKSCLKVYDGNKEYKNECRRLDILAYGDAFIEQSQKILNKLAG